MLNDSENDAISFGDEDPYVLWEALAKAGRSLTLTDLQQLDLNSGANTVYFDPPVQQAIVLKGICDVTKEPVNKKKVMGFLRKKMDASFEVCVCTGGEADFNRLGVQVDFPIPDEETLARLNVIPRF